MQQIIKLQTLYIITISLLVLGAVGLGLAHAPAVGAQGIKSNLCEGASLSLTDGGGDSCKETQVCVAEDKDGNCTKRADESEARVNKLITSIINIISVIVGILAVIFIIIGGAKYITSGGDSGKVSSAKSTVIYALVGLIIVALAQFIVRFVLSKT